MNRPAGLLPTMVLDRRAETPLFRQVYLAIRAAILSEQLAPGTRLPATRTLAQELGVARNTLINAFEQLQAEGYVEGRVGAGTVVARTLPDERLAAQDVTSPGPRGVGQRHALSEFGAAMLRAGRRLTPRATKAFEIDTPALDAFPFETWRRLQAQIMRAGSRRIFDDADPAGLPTLRAAIADYVWSGRGIRCTPEQIVVTGGGQSGIDMLNRILVTPGAKVWMEEPGEPRVRANFIAAGASIHAAHVDAHGLDVARAMQRCPDAQFAYVTPSTQYPLGVTMSMSRRMALLDWAAANSAWIFEDDCDSEFRYSSRPLAALKSLDTAGVVIYVGTFSRIVLPTLRLGYLILPADLVGPVLALRAISDRHPAPIEQQVLAAFLMRGHFATHIRRMRKLYLDRQRYLIATAASRLGNLLEVPACDAGMHAIGWLNAGVSDLAVSAAAAEAGIVARPLSSFYHAVRPRRGALLLGYAAPSPRQVREGMEVLARVIGAAT